MGLWDSINQFVANGQDRRAWLDDKVSGVVDYYTPPHLRQATRFAAEMNPIQGMSDSMSQFGVAMNPNVSMDDRRRAAVNSLTEGLLAVAPAALAARGYMTPVQGVMEGLLGGSPATQQIGDDVGRFMADDFGGVGLGGHPAPRNDAEAMARDILDLRAAGRASEVTDDMMAKADPQYMFNNTPLPMDVSSRMARAEEMGFDAGVPLYHGTTARDDFSSLAPSNRGRIGPGVYMSPNEKLASVFAGSDQASIMTKEPPLPNSRVIPLIATNNPADDAARGVAGAARREAGLGTDAGRIAFQRGLGEFDGVSMPTERTIIDPANIRSRFARFDPEFRHLANLSAGIGGLGLLGYVGNQSSDPLQTPRAE